mgnify:CR=1 FL=1
MTSEHVEGYVQMQIGGFLWGQNFEFAKSFVGPRFPPADDRVGILLNNRPEFVETAMACMKLGAIGPEDEAAFVIVELVVHEPLVRRQVEHEQPEASLRGIAPAPARLLLRSTT